MLDPYIIDFLKERERREQEDTRIPLHIHPPEIDDRERGEQKPGDTNKKGYIEIDISGEDKDDPNIIKM